MRILLVEDDPILGDGIAAGLRHDGYTVDWVTDGVQATTALKTALFDLLVLDLNLPGRPGIEILRELRGNDNKMPVLILTAKDTVDDRVRGLDSGADDYLVKPFDLDELLARIRALLRRSLGRSQPTITHGSLVLDPAAHCVTLEGKLIELSPGEFQILQMLLESSGRVLSRQHLEDGLYGWTKDIDSNTIEVHIHHLRRKVGNALIRNIRGVGYIIDKL
ncbi:MAG: response regulator transcription factor [Gammaproteobacteria bacterium]|nr:response regulator transcription factor [Gammaproteobacteria bacterium]